MKAAGEKRNRENMEFVVRFIGGGTEDIHDVLAPVFVKWANRKAGYDKYYVKKSSSSTKPF